MLSSEHRLSRAAEFSAAVRRGVRASRGLLTVHLLLSGRGAAPVRSEPVRSEPARAGLVVSRAVGGSVVRHRTSRRLRHLLRSRIASLPEGSLLVVRAAPGAGAADSTELGRDLDSALAAALRRAARAPAGAAR